MNERDPERDEIPAELRAAWRELAPPPLADASDDADPATAAAVRWARDAWLALEVPAARSPYALPRPIARRRSLRLVPLAAAAALVLGALGVALWRRGAPGARLAPPGERQEGARLEPGAGARAVEVLDVRPDQLELRSGPVRLVLLTPSGAATHTFQNEGI